MGRRPTSVVWDYFTKKTVSDGPKKTHFATCKICGTDTKFSNNTTNQLYHLRIHHQDVYKLIETEIQKPPKKSRDNGNQAPGGLLDLDNTEDRMSTGMINDYFLCAI
jgi:BED zinc finger